MLNIPNNLNLFGNFTLSDNKIKVLCGKQKQANIMPFFYDLFNAGNMSRNKYVLVFLKGLLSDLKQFLVTESHLKMMKSPFYLMLNALFVLTLFKILS